MNNYATCADNTLIDLIRRGDLDAFEALYDRYASKVLKRCYFICLNADTARDLMQDVWIRVFLRLHSFKKEAAFSTWLYRLTTNHCLNYLKSNRQSASLLKNLEIEKRDEKDPAIPAEVHQLLSKLSIEDRTMLAMKYMGEYTYEEIATTCGIGVSAAKMRLSRLIAKLRAEVDT